MNWPVDKWFDVIFIRKSRRQFNKEAIPVKLLMNLDNFVSELNASFEGTRVAIVNENAEQAFKGAIGSYGKIKGAPAYAAFIGDIRDPNVQEKVGYIGECFILEATSKGLATCWVGGFFKPEKVKEQLELSEHESVLAITPVGYAKSEHTFSEKLISGLASGHKRKNPEEIYINRSGKDLPNWLSPALEAARMAPSAVNRQPWRFTIKDDSVILSVDSPKDSYHISKRLDCGIAMLHFEIGASCYGAKGTWEYAAAPDVAVFKLNKDL